MLEIDGDALLEALPELKDIKLPKHKGRILAKKIQQRMGDLQNWDTRYVNPWIVINGICSISQIP